MKILTIGFLMLVAMSGQLNADNHPTTDNKIALNLDGIAEVLVKGFIAPIEYTQYGFHVEWDELANLQVAESEKRYPTSVFRAFLPPTAVSVGDLWKIEEEEGVLELLRQLHPKPNLDIIMNAGDSYGLWACLRAYNDKYAEIVFRIHAEFILADGRFTPSQFTGHLVIDRIKEKVASFKMYVPEGVLNFDVGRNSTRTIDVGFCPQIELRAEVREIAPDIEFAASITQEAAERKMVLRFYKSQQINWVSLEEALVMGPAQQKPIHVISIDGPLADEAC
ncbi:hypothetical protein F4X10_17370 [Candidatus Poribacteria bacterium]|nr:hypothetical protein [Candidatus Poribacteria bacterium]